MKDIELLEQAWADELARYDDISRLCEAKAIPVRDFLLCMVSENLRRIADTMDSQEDRDTFRMFHGR